MPEIARYRSAYLSAETEQGRTAVLKQLLLDSGFEVVANARCGSKEADLAVWSDELGAYVGNPLIIEVKRAVEGTAGLARASAQLARYIAAASASWGLLLYDLGPSAEQAESVALQNPQVLALSIYDLFGRLQHAPFVDIVRGLRNRRVHGAAR